MSLFYHPFSFIVASIFTRRPEKKALFTKNTKPFIPQLLLTVLVAILPTTKPRKSYCLSVAPTQTELQSRADRSVVVGMHVMISLIAVGAIWRNLLQPHASC